ncbi:MAG: DUF131 domain-containing protein [Candidatus Aenigmatarchaeota archaeon]
MENIIVIGFILVIVGMFLVAIGSILGTSGKTKVGVGGFIGPFVFGFGNDPRMVKFAVIITIVVAVIFLLFLFFR